jgi:hypothetical protein
MADEKEIRFEVLAPEAVGAESVAPTSCCPGLVLDPPGVGPLGFKMVKQDG